MATITAWVLHWILVAGQGEIFVQWNFQPYNTHLHCMVFAFTHHNYGVGVRVCVYNSTCTHYRATICKLYDMITITNNELQCHAGYHNNHVICEFEHAKSSHYQLSWGQWVYRFSCIHYTFTTACLSLGQCCTHYKACYAMIFGQPFCTQCQKYII